MSDEIVQALITRLQPAFYIIGILVVLGIISFGGTIISLWYKNKEKHDDAISQALAANTVAIARIESKLDIYIAKTEKDLNGLGKKIREIEV
jgi:hypothetical protein